MSAGTCPPLTLNNVVANTTTRDVGTVVSLQCEEGFTLKRGATIVECLPGAYWSDSVLYCREEKQDENNDQILIIIISAAATAVALGILIGGIYMLITNIRKEKKEKEADSPPPKKDIMETLKDLRLLNDAPQDSVGMPAVVYGNMNTILRGRVESSDCQPRSYQYCDTLHKMWQMNHRDCNKKVDCKWKKSTVTVSTCKKGQL